MSISDKGGMCCPKCGLGLLKTERQGVEMDYCPSCRGVWLDRGELDKVMEKTAALAPAVSSSSPVSIMGGAQARPHGGHRDDKRHSRRDHRSFLERLFD